MNNYYNQSFEFGNLYKAMKECCKNVRWKPSVLKYEANGLNNTLLLKQSIFNGKYKIKDYQHFKIHEPKERDICATRLPDRQVQRALCSGGLYQDITEHFIYDNCACQIGKGTDFALDRLKSHLLKFYRQHGTNGWVLKCDVKHFFDSTDHEIAKQIMRKYVQDDDAYKYVCDVIDSFEGDVGIGLGSQISQLIELCVLDGLDHIIKEQLHIKHYIRYMDDFILIHENKEYLKQCKTFIENHLKGLKLELNKKTNIYPLKQGVVFLKWRFIFTDTGRLLKLIDKQKIGRQRRKMRKLYQMELNGDVESGTTKDSLTSWISNASKGNTTKICNDMQNYFNSIKEKNYE